MEFTPREYQKLISDFIVEHERCNVFASMGTGKTSASIYTFDALRMFGEARKGLILAPRRVAQQSWPDEIVKWRESFGHLKIAAAIGTPAQRLAALRSGADLVAINYDNIEWLIDTVGDAWPWDTVFADESTRLKGLRISIQTSSKGNEFITGQGSSRAKALSHVAHKKVRRWVNLTGSPAPNGLQDLWGQMWFVDRGRRLGNSFTSFKDRWFRSVPGSSGHHAQIEPMKFAQREIEDLIRDVCITIDARDWFDIQEPVESVVKVQLPPKARAAYRDMEKKLFAELESGQEIEAFNAGSKCQKCLQLANGAVYTDDKGTFEETHTEKLDALKSVVTEANGESMLVRYTHKSDAKRILKAFPKFRMFDDNPKTLKEWNAGRIPGMVLHAASAGHGLSMQDGGRCLTDFSTDFNLEHDEQIIERIGPTRQAQSGYDRAVYRWRLIAEDTIEEYSALPRIKTKASVQDSLKSAMKRR